MTDEQATAFRLLRAHAAGGRFRVKADSEGWPMIPGRLGQIEWYCDGKDCWSCPLPGQLAFAVYTDRARLFARLWAIPRVRRWQTGEGEMRAVFLPLALPAVAHLIQARRRRILTPEAAQRLARTAYRATSRSQELVGAPDGSSVLSAFGNPP